MYCVRSLLVACAMPETTEVLQRHRNIEQLILCRFNSFSFRMACAAVTSAMAFMYSSCRKTPDRKPFPGLLMLSRRSSRRSATAFVLETIAKTCVSLMLAI